MQKYKKPDCSTLTESPFKSLFIIPVNTIVFKNQYTRNDNGELVNLKREVEQQPYVKMYVDVEKRKLVNNLLTASKDLYLWLLFTINNSEDYIWINKLRYMEETETSLNTYKKAVNELVTKRLLINTHIKDVYWINPDMFFKGDRIKKYPNNIQFIKTNDELIDQILNN